MKNNRIHKKSPLHKRIKKLMAITILAAVFLIIFALINFKQNSNTELRIEEPTINIISPLNQSYDTSNVILHVAGSKEFAWMKNSIDGGRNITACYNCKSYEVSFLQFSKGGHAIVVYAGDHQNKIAKAIVAFTLA